LLKKNKAAWNFFENQSPSYRKMIGWWIISAKKEETRMARLAKLISESAKGKRLLQLFASSGNLSSGIYAAQRCRKAVQPFLIAKPM
jgi:hypothetical protein